MSVSVNHLRNSEGVVVTEVVFRVILDKGWEKDLTSALSNLRHQVEGQVREADWLVFGAWQAMEKEK